MITHAIPLQILQPTEKKSKLTSSTSETGRPITPQRNGKKKGIM